MNAVLATVPVGFEGFLGFLDRRPRIEAWTLIDGEPVAVDRDTTVHAVIVMNLALSLDPAVRGRGFLVLGKMLVRNPAEDAHAPDLLVRCGPIQPLRWVTDPVAVIEVLSPSTRDLDRGPKLAFYKRSPSLRHVALVYQDSMRVEAYARDGDDWSFAALTRPEAILRFEALDWGLDLAAIYDGVAFE